MLRMLEAPMVPAAEVRGYVGRGVHELVGACLKTADPARIARGVAVYRARYADHLLDHSRLYPGVPEVVAHFSDRVQVVLTNKPSPFSQQLLRALGLARHFAQIITGDGQYPRKPDPTSTLVLLKTYELTPEQAMIIGDSEIDIETGKNSGVMTVAVAQGLTDEAVLRRAGPDALVADFPALLAEARRLQW
jgi:phosphoglycolate phosphatase